MVNKSFIFFCLLLGSLAAFAQPIKHKYWVQFTDKNNSPYSIEAPEQFLSQKAIERRQRQNIAIVQNDLPVNPSYVDSITNMGAQVLHRSKWFNGVTIYTDSLTLLEVLDLSFVQNYKPLTRKTKNIAVTSKYGTIEQFKGLQGETKQFLDNYGIALNQIEMIGGLPLHAQGYRGEGMVIAVLDAGFENINNMSVFDKMFQEGRILGMRDFVSGGTNVIGHHNHGTHVLSTMAADLPGQMIGTAPDASYWLIRTEEGGSELLIEEYNWAAGAEFADSVGADIINSSLGYTTFDDATQNHTYADMDGNTTPVTNAADLAASKGILVVTSAGNSGASSWYYISAPADGDSVLAVGAVDSAGVYASFSSRGPAHDGRVKPNVAAKGAATTIASSWDGSIVTGNGTSFAGPVIAGMAACLWQANPTVTNMELFDFIQRSSSQFQDPDDKLGFGIPNFSLAHLELNRIQVADFNDSQLVHVSPNPFDDNFTVHFYSSDEQYAVFQLCDMTGKLLINKNCDMLGSAYYQTTFDGFENLSQGIYVLAIRTNKRTYYTKLLKQ